MTHILALSRSDTQDSRLVLGQGDSSDPGKHLPEMFLYLLHVLAVPDDVQQIFVSHEVKPERSVIFRNSHRNC